MPLAREPRPTVANAALPPLRHCATTERQQRQVLAYVHRRRPWTEVIRRHTFINRTCERKMRAFLSLLLLSSCVSIQAQVYRAIGPDGQTVFSDRPLPNGERIELLVDSADAAADDSAARRGADADSGFLGPYDMFEIVSPENDHRTRDPDGPLPVSLVLSPALMDGHRMVIEVDGIAATGEVPRSTQLLVNGLALGTHRIRVLIEDADSASVAATPSITVHVLRPLPEGTQP